MLSQVREGRSCKVSLKVMLGCACSNGVCLFERLFERNRGHALPCVCLAAAAAAAAAAAVVMKRNTSVGAGGARSHAVELSIYKCVCVCVCVCVCGVRTRMGAGTRIQLTHASNTRYAGALD